MNAANWKPFDYANPPPEGVYWLVVNTPEYDVDADEYGNTIGAPTGEVSSAVCMASVSVDRDGQVQFDAVDRWTFGEVSDEASVSHFAEVEKPKLPTTMPAAEAITN